MSSAMMSRMLGLVIIPSAADANKDALARMAERIHKVRWFMGLAYWFSRHHTPSGSRLLPVSPSLLPQAAVCAYTRIATLFLRGKTISALGKNPVLTPTPSKNIVPSCRVPLRLRAIFGLVTQSPWSVRYGGLLSIR